MSKLTIHKKRKIIIIEDEPAHAEALKRYLSESEDECNIIIASTLREFYSIVRETIPDLIIADLNLPDGNAFSLLNKDLDYQPWPVLIMSSYGDEETAVTAIKSGALDYMVKSPDSFSNIIPIVKRNLREWQNIQKSRESEKKFRILFETMDQGAIYQDSTGKITAINSAAEKITGYTLEEMQDMSFFDPGPWVTINDGVSIKSAESHPASAALRSGLPVKNRIMGIQNPQTGRFVWMLVSAMPQFRENDNVPYQVFTTFTDITKLKQTETELKEAKKKAEESDRLKSAFMANMSHEIRTPMNGILGFADLLKTPELSGESQTMYINAINSSGKRMLDIINDLIDISKIEAGQIELKREITNVNDLLRELLMFFRPESEIKGIELRADIQLPSDDFMIDTDRTKVAQVITNLIKNALKFTPRSGFIELGCRKKDNENLLFYIKDSGTGIRTELQEKIFERFRQGDNAHIHEGVGLGLAISKAYVELMGGSIGLDSEPGKGSLFFFTLPFNEQTRLRLNQHKKQNSPETAFSDLCILIAEDDDINYTLLKESLKKVNISTCRARNGQEALDMVKGMVNISLILMDIKLPVMNGKEAAREIKKIKPEIPIIAQSAYVSDADIRQSLEAGCDDYITKPIDIKLLLNKISRHSMPVI